MTNLKRLREFAAITLYTLRWESQWSKTQRSKEEVQVVVLLRAEGGQKKPEVSLEAAEDGPSTLPRK